MSGLILNLTGQILSHAENNATSFPHTVVSRSAHGIHFLDKSYELYRDRCLELWGIRYEDIEVYIDQSYNPLRLPRVEAD